MQKETDFDLIPSKRLLDKKMDMTPMVDVTFLLLIFFMVTASFTLQKSMDWVNQNRDEPSLDRRNPDAVPNYVAVFVSPDNEFRVRKSENEWADAPNRHELRIHLAKALQDSSPPEELLLFGHSECFHDKVVQAMDIGIELDYKIRIIMTEEEF